MSVLLENDSPPASITSSEFVNRAKGERYRTRDYLRRWDSLYAYHEAEFCDRRRLAFERSYATSLSSVNSVELCLVDRYTACVNLRGSRDGYVRHVCDILPIVIGSNLDRKIRSEFWSRDRESRYEDEMKIGFLIQNKNLYNFTVCMATNPKVAHIYRRSNKSHQLDSRLYYYDNNFRGNMFYFEQTIILLRCANCEKRATLSPEEQQRSRATPSGACQGLVIVIAEGLYLRNCFKQDHLLLRRFCSRSATHFLVDDIISKYFQQKDRHVFIDEISALSTDVRAYVRDIGCLELFARFSRYVSRYNDSQMDQELLSFLEREFDRSNVETSDFASASSSRRRVVGTVDVVEKMVIKLTNDKNLSRLLLCDCDVGEIRADFQRFRQSTVDSHRASSSSSERRRDSGEFSGDSSFWILRNLDEFEKINSTCFPAWTKYGDEDLREKLFVLYMYMREIMLCNEDIDLLCNKCIFDGPYLYNQLMLQLREYLCKKYSVRVLNHESVDTLVSRYRSLAHTANLYMLISSKTNIRVDLTNDLKRSLKLSIKREKMQQFDNDYLTNSSSSNSNVMSCGLNAMNVNCVSSASIGAVSGGSSVLVSSNAVSAAPPPVHHDEGCVSGRENEEVSLVAGNSRIETHYADDYEDSIADPDADLDCDMDANEKCDFIVKRQRFGKYRNLFTGLYVGREKTIVVSSGGENDFNVKQLITYDSQHLLHNVASSHFTDTEFVFEQVKRPRIINQQNSSKCALMPREAVRFLSYYNIGNMSIAGRTMNLCARTRLSFFVNPYHRICERYYEWLKIVYAKLRGPNQTSITTCRLHRSDRCSSCFLYLMINEIACTSFMLDRYYESRLFVLSKIWWSSVQFYRKTNFVLSVTVISGVIFVPMILVNGGDPNLETSIRSADPDSWDYCSRCQLYFPSAFLDRSSNLFYVNADISRDIRTIYDSRLDFTSLLLDDGNVDRCPTHVWLSSNDVQYYEHLLSTYISLNPDDHIATHVSRGFAEPFFYEVACHGLFLNYKFVDATDISKLTVAINASKRRLRLRSSLLERSGRLETLMDQNTRMVVNDCLYRPDSIVQWRPLDRPGEDSASLPDNLAPRNTADILTVSERNSFFCCFMFGDYRGQNCEDAYIFDEASRPSIDNSVQLKVNYYKFDRANVNFDKLKFFLKPVTYFHSPNGCTFFLGYLYSPYKLSFGSTFVHIKVIQCSADMWLYRFYYTNWSSYLRPGQQIMRDADPSGETDDDGVFHDRGLQFDESTITERYASDFNVASSSPHPTVDPSVTRIVYEASCLSNNRNVELSVQMTTRQIRFFVVLKKLQIVQKLQNNCGQKGVATYCDLSDLYTEDGGRVHAIVSIYSVNGRQLLSQILEQYSRGGLSDRYERKNLMRVYSRSKCGRQVGWAGIGEFFFSCDSPHDNIIVSSPNFGNNAMRMCNMTYFAAIGNNLSTWILNRAADYVNYKNNPMNSMPVNIQNCLTVYHYFSRQIYPRNLRLRELRKKIKYWYELTRRGIRVDLPASIRL